MNDKMKKRMEESREKKMKAELKMKREILERGRIGL